MTPRAGRLSENLLPLTPSKARRSALPYTTQRERRNYGPRSAHYLGTIGYSVEFRTGGDPMGPSMTGCFVGPVGAVAHDIPGRRPLPRLITKDVNRG